MAWTQGLLGESTNALSEEVQAELMSEIEEAKASAEPLCWSRRDRG